MRTIAKHCADIFKYKGKHYFIKIIIIIRDLFHVFFNNVKIIVRFLYTNQA